jgi:hypothetical protein
MEPLEELKKEIVSVKAGLGRIERALLGDKEFESKGMVHEVDELKKYKEKDEKFKAKVAGGFAVGIPVVGAAWTFFIDWLKGK